MTNKLSITRRISLAATGFTLLGGALLGGAKPALATGSGLSNYPSTDIYPKGNLHFDADYFTSTSGNTQTGSSLGLEYGAGPERDGLFGRTEFGIDYVNTSSLDANRGERVAFNAKTQLYNNSASGIRATLGVYGVGSRQIGAANWVNLLSSKAFSFGRITVGGAYALRQSVLGGAPRSVFQLGYDKAINDKFIFAADYQSGKGQFISPGLIYLINDKAGVELSYLRGGSAVAPRNQIYFGFDYNFGKVYAPPTSPDAPAGDAGAGGAGGGAGGGGGG
ncbi:hypothetical protein B1R32_102201 [Abditibacterium utsteinense]|uniref:Uncharacterized protein n=1 Tax=Abditibacterium utsteinense TaxID=1960156 RepID=A0A2S8SWM0_9BACT|nr:hypothetical protein [Abditibacterium utsteinense]PQV65192.1 hypothetical protein B1R32_102201 [Abditibacterium utsteinense]